MFLRIDVYPHNVNVNDEDDEGMPVSPMDPLHACVGTTGANGELFTVGRKDSTIILSDKSVSRQHLTVTLVSATAKHGGGGAIEDRETIQPRTPEEQEACQNDPDGMCLVLTDSSRFGTFLVKEGVSIPHDKPSADEDEDATDGDETEDESQRPHSRATAATSNAHNLSPVTAKLTDSNATLQKLDPNSSHVISDFNDRIIIQCGQNGSTLVIRRIPLVFLWSRLDKSTRDLWTKRLPVLGARSLTVANDTMTHLVTTERTANPKNLVAWCLQRPNVTTGFLQALWDRRSPKDGMPKESDCAPTEGGKDDFWKNKPNSTLWKGCTYICLLKDDMESLCRAAGASVVTLYDLPEKEALQKIKDMNVEHSFYISTTSNKVTKLVRQLKKRDAPHVTQKALAMSVVKFQRLKDEKGNDIGPAPTEMEVDEEEALPPSPPEDDTRELKMPSLPPIETIPEASREMSEQSMEQPNVEESVDTSVQEASGTAKAGIRKKRSNASQSSQEMEEPPKQRRKMSKDADRMETDEKSLHDVSGKGRKEEPKKSRMDEELDDWKDGDEPKKLTVANDGWLVAAPSGKRRKAYRKPIDDYITQEDLPPEACTEKCPTLVVGPRKNKANSTYAATASSSSSRGRHGGGKDFKRFRKNRVIKGRSGSRIVLRSVLPKESEVERELEKRQRALQEEQRLADALFGDSGSSGIRSHFKPKKRKR